MYISSEKHTEDTKNISMTYFPAVDRETGDV